MAQAGPWTPEAAVEEPEAVRQLHREFLRAGADVMQVTAGAAAVTLATSILLTPSLHLLCIRGQAV